MRQFSPHSILVLHPGRLAEIVLSQPALKALRQRFPHAHITLATTSVGGQVGAMTTAVSDLLLVDGLSWTDALKPWVAYRWLRFLQDIRQGGYDFAIDLHSHTQTNLLAWLSQAPVRLAARRPGKTLDFLFTLRAPREDPRKHLVDRYLDILQPLGVQAADRQPQLTLLPEANAKVEKRLAQQRRRRGGLLIGIYPGRSASVPRWPAQWFAELGVRLAHNLSVDLLLFGGKGNSKVADLMAQELPNKVITLDDLTIPELASALAECSALISDDAGVANLAAAVNTPVLGLGIRFPLAPLGDEHVIFQRTDTTSIAVDEAFTAASRIITRDRTSALFEK